MGYKYNFTAVLELPVPPKKIYEILIDPLKMSKYVPTVIDVKIVSKQTQGQGVISRWQSRRPDGSTAEWNETIAVAESDKRMIFKYLESSDTQGEYVLTATKQGTTITFTESMQKMIGDKNWHQKHVEEILANIKRAFPNVK